MVPASRDHQHPGRGIRRRAFGLLLAVILAAPGLARADIIELSDGRRFEGDLLAQNNSIVKIDTRVRGIRTTLSFPRAEIKTIEEGELAPGFFDPPPADPRVSDPKKSGEGQVFYLEVPIVGEFGEDVFAGGVRSALSYAKRHGIEHVVFTIETDSANLDEALAFYRLLKTRKGTLKLHAVVKNCLGEGLAVALWCDTVTLLPGAKIGGLGRKLSEISEKIDPEEEDVVRAQMAEDAIRHTGKSGALAEIVRAMLDPSETLAIWKDDEGDLATGANPPEGVAAKRVVVSVDEGTPLQLSSDHIKAFGRPLLEGSAKDLGKLLGIEGWALESDYGSKVMERVAVREKKKASAKQAAFEKKVRRNIDRREATERSIAHNMQKAAEWDPTESNYETYSRRWNWGWGWDGEWRTKQLTEDSRKKWRNRTDACMHFLKRAGKGLTAMKRLDEEANKLGLETTYKEGVIDDLLADLKARLVVLHQHRDKRTK